MANCTPQAGVYTESTLGLLKNGHQCESCMSTFSCRSRACRYPPNITLSYFDCIKCGNAFEYKSVNIVDGYKKINWSST